MAFNKTTILFISGKSKKIRKINIPHGLLSLFTFFIFLITISAIWALNDYRNAKDQIAELNSLKSENRTQKTQLIALTKKINSITQKVDKLQSFDHRLKDIAGLEPSNRQNQFLSVGGSDISSLKSDYQMEEVHKGLIRQMHESLDTIETKITATSLSQTELDDFFKEQKSILASTPSIKPVNGWIASGFGYRISPFTNEKEFHKGIDIANRIGTPVFAPADGIVVFAGKEGNYGKMIAINHGHNLKTRYGHLHKLKVKKGTLVKRGQIIGELGKSGRCTGPHLHYEVLLSGIPVNPIRYILN